MGHDSGPSVWGPVSDFVIGGADQALLDHLLHHLFPWSQVVLVLSVCSYGLALLSETFVLVQTVPCHHVLAVLAQLHDLWIGTVGSLVVLEDQVADPVVCWTR